MPFKSTIKILEVLYTTEAGTTKSAQRAKRKSKSTTIWWFVAPVGVAWKK